MKTGVTYEGGLIQPIRCLSEAWEDIKEDYWHYFVATLITGLIGGAAGMLPVLSIVLSLIVMGPLMAGHAWFYTQKADGHKPELNEIFSGFKKFVPNMLIGIIIGIPGLILGVYQIFDMVRSILILSKGEPGLEELSNRPIDFNLLFIYAFMIVFGLTVGVMLTFAYYLVMDHGVSAGTAIKLSAEAAIPNYFRILGLSLLMFLVLLAGCLALLIGILFVSPVLALTFAKAYRQVFPAGYTPEKTDVPPPPSEYPIAETR